MFEAIVRHLRWVGVDSNKLRRIWGKVKDINHQCVEVNSGPNHLDALSWDVLWHLRYTGTSFMTSGLTLRQIGTSLKRVAFYSGHVEWCYDDSMTIAGNTGHEHSQMRRLLWVHTFAMSLWRLGTLGDDYTMSWDIWVDSGRMETNLRHLRQLRPSYTRFTTNSKHLRRVGDV